MSWFQILILFGFASIIFALYDLTKSLHVLCRSSFWANVNRVDHERLSSISDVLREIEHHLLAINSHLSFTEAERDIESLKDGSIFEQAVLNQQHKVDTKPGEPLGELGDRIGKPSMVNLMEEIRDRLQSINDNLRVVLKGVTK